MTNLPEATATWGAHSAVFDEPASHFDERSSLFDERSSVLDESTASDRIDFQLARAEFATWQLTRAAAEQMAAIVHVLDEARRHPEVYLHLADEPTKRDVEIALDAAIADLAVRLSIAEGTVVILERQGIALRTRAPRVWAAFHEGEISTANARRVADTLETLPVHGDAGSKAGADSKPGADSKLDAKAIELAGLAPARFRERMRVLRERLHPRALDERHREASEGRSVVLDAEPDGMAWLGIRLAAPDAQTAWERIDQAARHLADCVDESRTLAQLRADVAADILTGRIDAGTEPHVTVGVLIPMLTLLGRSDEPATLDGYGPIDADTARRLAAHAPSFHRILTHPVSGTVMDVDRTTYRPPADLKRWLALRDGTCRFPGCGRSAKHCDLDHTLAWSDGGTTSARNLAHLSRRHHTLKHRSRWSVEHSTDGTITWTSPTGHISTADPPPF
ncbi:MAG: DUF222 domain-containing protein [Pseudolysinimonas sp.]|uniref:HNH endonuclease signature motif containing protein n=1 Tax=Pseudolysinimonas sp. TaxID=2680009 RepID=UPI0032647A86